jgi:hypothetical protein
MSAIAYFPPRNSDTQRALNHQQHLSGQNTYIFVKIKALCSMPTNKITTIELAVVVKTIKLHLQSFRQLDNILLFQLKRFCNGPLVPLCPI